MPGSAKACFLRADLEAVLVAHGALSTLLALGNLNAVNLVAWSKLRAGRAARDAC